MNRDEIEFRRADLRDAARDAQDPTLTPAERATARAAMNDHLDALAEAGAIQHDVTLTRPNGESATFGPMPTRDAALVALAAAATGHSARIDPDHDDPDEYVDEDDCVCGPPDGDRAAA